MSTAIPVTPAVTYYDPCGTENDAPIPVEMEGVTYTVEVFNEEEGIIQVLAFPDPGYKIVPDMDAGWGYFHSGAEGTLLVFPSAFTDVPCKEGEESVPAPITMLPETGSEQGLFLIGVVGIALLTAGALIAIHRALNRGRQKS